MEFRLLGPLEAVRDGRSLALGGAKQRAVLAVLLLHRNEVVPAERVVDLVWGESPPATAANALQGYVFQLRKVLEPHHRRGQAYEVLASAETGYVLRAPDGCVDADRFTDLAETARGLVAADPDAAVDRLREALGLWRGPALADLAYEPFAQSEIARLEELRLAVVEDRIDAELAVGRHTVVVAELEALVAEHPLLERLRGQFVLALYRSGRQAEALEAYRSTRETLVEELGIDPSPALQELERAILRQDPALAVPARAPAAAPSPAEPPPLEAERARDQRKTVTVLCCELVQSVGELDPETVRAVTSRYFAVVSAVVERHGGTVERSLGTALLAVWGVPRVHEDDALRAVRSAGELGAALDELNQELEETWGARLVTRIGVNTGEVVAGDVSTGDALVTGDAVIVAVRLQQAAEPETILIGDATWRLVRDAVVADPIERLDVDGRRDPFPVRRLREVLAGAEGVRRRLDAPFVGRELELAQLSQAFERAVRERRGALFTVLGAAGIGKSRLALELAAQLGDEARVVAGRCLPYGEGITFWPVAEIVREALGEDVRAGVTLLFGGDGDAEAVADLIEALVGEADAAARPEETQWAVRRLVEELARDRPLVLVWEDVHWAEPALLDLIEHLADWLHDSPVLLLCLARPEFLDDRPGWGGGKLNSATVLLEPLTDAQSATLVDALARMPLDDEARRTVETTAGGNPLFVEQLLATLEETGAAGPGIRVPPTIEALLAARIDRLGPGERVVIEAAAVVGQELWHEAVAELVPEAARDSVAAHLRALVRKELLRPARPTFPGGDGFAFRHILIRDAAYRSIAKELRSELHGRFADWLEANGVAAAESDELLGYHLEQAYRYRCELGAAGGAVDELGFRAGRALTAAGRRANARGDVRAAAGLLSRAADLAPSGIEASEVRLALADALVGVGDLAGAERAIAAACAEASSAGDARMAAHARLEELLLRTLLDPTFDTHELLAEAEDAIGIFERAGDDRGLARAWRAVAEVHLTRCSWGRSAEAFERALEHATLAEEPREVALALTHLANAHYWGPTPAGAAGRRFEEILAGVSGQPSVEATLLCYLGGIRAMAGAFAEALELVGRGRDLFAELGDVYGVAALTVVSGPVLLLADDAPGAESDLRAAAEALRGMGETGILPSIEAFLAEAVLEQGREQEAIELTRSAEDAAAADDVASQIAWRAVRARAIVAGGRSDEARDLADAAVALAAETDFLVMHGDALLAAAEVARVGGETAEGARLAAEATALYEAKGHTAAAARLRERLASASGV